MKSIPKLLTALFLLVFIVEFLSFLLIAPVSAADTAKDILFKPQITIGNFIAGKDQKINEYSIGKYIIAIYKYSIGIVGIVAAVVMMIGGLTWLTAGGNQTKIGEAKERLVASLTGLLLTLGSFMILATVNPKLTQFEPIRVAEVPSNASTNTSTNTSKSKDNLYCKEDSVCGDNFMCDLEINRCKSTTLNEGVTCDSDGKCASVLLYCINRRPGIDPGLCYNGSSGDPCVNDSECNSGACALRDGFWFCTLQTGACICE